MFWDRENFDETAIPIKGVGGPRGEIRGRISEALIILSEAEDFGIDWFLVHFPLAENKKIPKSVEHLGYQSPLSSALVTTNG